MLASLSHLWFVLLAHLKSSKIFDYIKAFRGIMPLGAWPFKAHPESKHKIPCHLPRENSSFISRLHGVDAMGAIVFRRTMIDSNLLQKLQIKVRYNQGYADGLGRHEAHLALKMDDERYANANRVWHDIKYKWGDYELADSEKTEGLDISANWFAWLDQKIETEKRLLNEAAEKKNFIFAEAKRTNQKVLLRSFMDRCNDPNEECSSDSVVIYAMPDGTTKTERTHTW